MVHQRGMKVPVRNLNTPSKIETFVDLRKVSEEIQNLYWKAQFSLIYLSEGKIYGKCSNGTIIEIKEN